MDDYEKTLLTALRFVKAYSSIPMYEPEWNLLPMQIWQLCFASGLIQYPNDTSRLTLLPKGEAVLELLETMKANNLVMQRYSDNEPVCSICGRHRPECDCDSFYWEEECQPSLNNPNRWAFMTEEEST